jgi:UDP-galactopyranose mutase
MGERTLLSWREIAGRIRSASNRDDRYFQIPIQGIPEPGYTPYEENMLNHP